MKQTSYIFTFGIGVNLGDVDATMRLSLIAAEGIHGEARLRTDVAYAIEPMRSTLRLAGEQPAIETVAQIFTAFLTREFGAGAFTVRRDTSAGAERAA